MARKRSIPKECPHIKILTLFVILIKSCYKDFFIFFQRAHRPFVSGSSLQKT